MTNKKTQMIVLLMLALLLVTGGLYTLHQQQNAYPLPILMYHHFAETAELDTVVTADRFREHMNALQEAGFTAVTLQQMVDYVGQGAALPEKPVLITFDDGYTSNLTIAAPILEELGMCATVFVIGINEGEEVYPHSGEPLYLPRFSYEEAAPWVKKGVLDLQCHTFDMHQLADYGFSGRDGMLPLSGESEAAYRQALAADLNRFRQRRDEQISTPLIALAYPFGYYTNEADRLTEEEGFSITFTTDMGCAHLEAGDTDSLRLLPRINVPDHWSGIELVQRLAKASGLW